MREKDITQKNFFEDGAKSLREMIDLPEEDEELRQEMLKRIPDYRIQVYDLNKERDFTAFQTSLKTVFEFYNIRKNKDELRNYMDTHREEIEELDRESKFFLATMLGQKKLRKKLLKKETMQEEGSMCKAIDDMLEDSWNDGLEKGREEGKAEGRAEAEKIIAELKKEIEGLKKWLAV